MAFYVQRFWLSLFLIVSIRSILCSALSAQTAPESAVAPSEYLARLERGQLSKDACALINRNGQYRFERGFPNKTDVFLGTLYPEQLRRFEEMLNRESLVRLSLGDIPNPLITDSSDLFLLDVFRREGLQQLRFKDASSRKPFRDSVGQIVSWFDQLRKLPHTQIAEANASRCMPTAHDLQNGSLPIKPVEPRDTAYLLTWSKEHSVYGAGKEFLEGLSERNCIIVYADGRYRMEKSNQRLRESMTTRAFEATLSSAQIADLQKILSSSELANLRHDLDRARPASEVEITRLVIPRGTTIQRLSFGSYLNVFGNSRQVGGLSNLQYGVDQERNLIKPLQQWLEKTIERNKLPGPTDTHATNCAPSH